MLGNDRPEVAVENTGLAHVDGFEEGVVRRLDEVLGRLRHAVAHCERLVQVGVKAIEDSGDVCARADGSMRAMVGGRRRVAAAEAWRRGRGDGGVAAGGRVRGRGTDVDDIAVLKLAEVGDAVADDFVHGGADRLGEVEIMEGRRVRAVLDGELVHHAIDLICRHAGPDDTRRRVQNLAAELVHLRTTPHAPPTRAFGPVRRSGRPVKTCAGV